MHMINAIFTKKNPKRLVLIEEKNTARALIKMQIIF